MLGEEARRLLEEKAGAQKTGRWEEADGDSGKDCAGDTGRSMASPITPEGVILAFADE